MTAQNGDGSALPAGTIQQAKDVNDKIESIEQPLQGFGGKHAESSEESAVHFTLRTSNKHRAVNGIDYEKIAIEQFPEICKVVCLPTEVTGKANVTLVVFGNGEDNEYHLLPLSLFPQTIR